MNAHPGTTDLLSSPREGNVTMRDLLTVLFKHGRHMLLICATALLVAAGYLLLAEPVYVAHASVLIKLGKDELSAIETIPREQNNFLLQQRGQIINNEIEILRSEGLAWRVAPIARQKKDDMAAQAYAAAGPIRRQLMDARRAVKDAIEPVRDVVKETLVMLGISRRVTEEQAFAIELARNIDIEAIEETEVVRIGFSTDNAEYAAFVANAYLDEYYRTRVKVHSDERSEQFYEEQIRLLQGQLQRVESDIASFLQARGITNLELQKDLLVREIADLEKQFFQVDLALRETSVRRRGVQQAATGQSGVVPTPPAGSGANYNSLDEAYFKLAAEQAQLGARFDPSAREVTDVNEQQAKLRHEKAAGVGRSLAGDAAVRMTERARIENRLRELKADLETLNDATTPLADLKRNRDLLSASYLAYAKQTEQLRLSFDLNRAEITSVKTLTRAFPPILPAAPKRPLVLALALAAALFLSFAWAVLAEFFNHTFRDERDVEAQLGLPTLASLGWDPHLVQRGAP